jgi:hypothetical protein
MYHPTVNQLFMFRTQKPLEKLNNPVLEQEDQWKKDKSSTEQENKDGIKVEQETVWQGAKKQEVNRKYTGTG